jgi:hypothetical protein
MREEEGRQEGRQEGAGGKGEESRSKKANLALTIWFFLFFLFSSS